jgi:hypothetical protein
MLESNDARINAKNAALKAAALHLNLKAQSEERSFVRRGGLRMTIGRQKRADLRR